MPGAGRKQHQKGELKDGKEEVPERERAREETRKRGGGNLFDAFPQDRKATTIQEHIAMGLQYKPQPGVPWSKTWRIREEASTVLYKLYTLNSSSA